MVDWSANSTPRTGRDSIWIAGGAWRRRALQVASPSNPATRHAAMAEIDRAVDAALGAGRRIVVGFDFPLSYPAGLTTAFPSVFGPGPPWRAVWRTLAERIEDRADNTNNRWEVASALNRDTGCRLFWGCPASRAGPYLAVNDRPVRGLAERGERLGSLRLAERRAVGVGGAIQSPWKLAYAGSVGSQALLGIPHLEALRARYGDRLRVWPFEFPRRPGGAVTGPGEAQDVLGGRASGAVAVVTEIWPTAFAVDWARHPVRDAAQVLRVLEACADADRRGRLGDWLLPTAGPAEQERIDEEGWILGVR